jgi:hypothetical protein
MIEFAPTMTDGTRNGTSRTTPAPEPTEYRLPPIHKRSMTEGMSGSEGTRMRSIARRTLSRIALALLIIALFATFAQAQTPVSLAPVPRMQFFNAAGQPLAGGLVATMVSGTNTPLATYTDATGTIQNSNPVVLDSGGFASIWVASGSVYTFTVYDQNSVMQWSVSGITGPPNLSAPGPIGNGVASTVRATAFISASSLPALTGLVQLASGDTICWRNNANTADICINKNTADQILFGANPFALTSVNQSWTGVPTFTVAPIFSASPGFSVTNTLIPNLNASLLLGATWSAPLAIGGGTSNAGTFTNLTAASFVLNGSGPLTTVSGTSANLGNTASDVHTDAAGLPLCADGAGNITGSSCDFAGKTTTKLLTGNVSLSGLTTVDSQAVTMPTTGCPCRVAVKYSYGWAATTAATADAVVAYVVDSGTGVSAKNYAWTGSDTPANNSSGALSGGQESQTYAAGTVVTFTVKAQTNASSIAISEFDPVIGSLQSYLELKVETNQQ